MAASVLIQPPPFRCMNITYRKRITVQSSLAAPGLEWGCDTYTNENARLLQDWLASRGLPPQKLALRRVDTGGRGLVATTNIRKGQRLLYVPASLIITKDSEWSNFQAGSVLISEGISEWPLLASYLISEASQGCNSPWSAYISALPRQPESILLWSQQEVNEYLFASSILKDALERISEVENTYQNIHTFVFSKYPQLFPTKFFTLENFRWAFGILFSRLVRLQSLDEQVALVPWADMLNHSSEVKTLLDFDPSSKSIVLTTDKTYQPAEQVFVSYGSKSKGEVFLSYGFVPMESIEGDFVELEFSLKADDVLFRIKNDALKENALNSCCKYPVTMRGLPEQLLAFARLSVCPPSMSSQIPQMAAAAASRKSSGRIWQRSAMMHVDVDIQAYELILSTIEASLSKLSLCLENYGTGLSDKIERKLNLDWKLALANTLHTAEQRILYRAQFLLRSKLRELQAQKASATTDFLVGLKNLFK